MSRKTKAEIAREHVPHPLFDEFWGQYPRKVNRLEASIAFARLDPDSSLMAKIMFAVESQKVRGCLRVKFGGDKSYIPHASTWLNQRRWDDELEPVTTANLDRGTSYARDTLLDVLTPGTGHVVTHAANAGRSPRALPGSE